MEKAIAFEISRVMIATAVLDNPSSFLPVGSHAKSPLTVGGQM
jgi:hypothetical protein